MIFSYILFSFIFNVSVRYIKLKSGAHLVMYDGYTFHKLSKRYYCSNRNKGCKVRLILDESGERVATQLEEHNGHSRPRFYLSNEGHLIRM